MNTIPTSKGHPDAGAYYANLYQEQRLRADTAEAELEVLKYDCQVAHSVIHAQKADIVVAEQRIAELKGLLLDITLDDDFPEHWNEAYAIDAALNPNPEAESHEPQCLLCLDKKTVPGNIPGGFVKDCPDCCGEEG